MSNVNNEDRRTRKTKKALREALVALLHKKNIQNITVKELTDEADIHRSTFYANFKDVYDLYEHMEVTMIQEICAIVLTDYTFKPEVFYFKLLDYINSNRQLSRLFFGGNISASLFERLTDLFKNSCVESWCKECNVTSVSVEMDYYVQFCLSGVLGAIGLWVSKDFDSPVEKLVSLLADIESGVKKVFESKFS